jgi:hypothetical protein
MTTAPGKSSEQTPVTRSSFCERDAQQTARLLRLAIARIDLSAGPTPETVLDTTAPPETSEIELFLKSVPGASLTSPDSPWSEQNYRLSGRIPGQETGGLADIIRQGNKWIFGADTAP